MHTTTKELYINSKMLFHLFKRGAMIFFSGGEMCEPKKKKLRSAGWTTTG